MKFLTMEAFRTLKLKNDSSKDPPYYIDANDTRSLDQIIIA